MKFLKLILFFVFVSSAVLRADEFRYPLPDHKSNREIILLNFENSMKKFLKIIEDNGTKAEDIIIVIVTAENDRDFQNAILEQAQSYFPTIKFKIDKATNKYTSDEYEAIDKLQDKYMSFSHGMASDRLDVDTYTDNLNQLSKLIDQYTEIVNNYLISSGKDKLENFSYNTDIDNLILTNKIFTFNNEILLNRLYLFFSGIKGIHIDEKSSFNQDNLNLLFEVFDKLNSLKNIVTSKTFDFINNEITPEFDYYKDGFRIKANNSGPVKEKPLVSASGDQGKEKNATANEVNDLIERIKNNSITNSKFIAAYIQLFNKNQLGKLSTEDRIIIQKKSNQVSIENFILSMESEDSREQVDKDVSFIDRASALLAPFAHNNEFTHEQLDIIEKRVNEIKVRQPTERRDVVGDIMIENLLSYIDAMRKIIPSKEEASRIINDKTESKLSTYFETQERNPHFIEKLNLFKELAKKNFQNLFILELMSGQMSNNTFYEEGDFFFVLDEILKPALLQQFRIANYLDFVENNEKVFKSKQNSLHAILVFMEYVLTNKVVGQWAIIRFENFISKTEFRNLEFLKNALSSKEIASLGPVLVDRIGQGLELLSFLLSDDNKLKESGEVDKDAFEAYKNKKATDDSYQIKKVELPNEYKQVVKASQVVAEAQISKDVSKLLKIINPDEFIVKTKVFISNPVKTLNIDEISLLLNEYEKLSKRVDTVVPTDVIKSLAFRVEEIITNKGQVPIAGSNYVEAFYKRKEEYLKENIAKEKLFDVVKNKVKEAKRITENKGRG